MVEHDIEHGKEHEIEQATESEIIRQLQARVEMSLPPPLLRNETRRALSELVQSNRERGVPDEMLKSKEKELVEGAAQLAAHRLKTNFILQRIAEAEKIEVTRDDIEERIRRDALRYNVSVEKLRHELEEHDGISALADEVLLAKTLDFLKANVSVETASDSAGGDDKSEKNA
jgi:trigger factor